MLLMIINRGTTFPMNIFVFMSILRRYYFKSFVFEIRSFTNCDQYDDVNSMFYLYPSDDAILNTMLMAAEKYKWKSAIVLGEKNKGKRL